MSDSDSDESQHIGSIIADLQRELDDESGDDDIDADIEAFDSAISTNDKLYTKLQQTMLNCQNMLINIRKRIKELNESFRTETIPTKVQEFKPRRFGMPYFRDSNDRTPPQNQDTIVKSQLGMVNCFNLLPGNNWTFKDKAVVEFEIRMLSQKLKKTQLSNELSDLKRSQVNETTKIKLQKKLSKQIESVDGCSIEEVALPIEFEYDWELIVQKLRHRHTENEVKAMWKQCLHPSLKKTNLTSVETTLLSNLAYERGLQDWEWISNELGGTRSPYQCFVLYRSIIADDESKGSKWTPEEDEFLKQNIEFYRNGEYIPWSVVSNCFQNRKKVQIYNRYTRGIKPDLRKGRFIPEEDAVILAAIKEYGLDYKKISQFVPGRSIYQLQTRYNSCLRRRQSVTWTVEEDKKLLHLMSSRHSESENYSYIAKQLKNKDRTNVRMRHSTLKKWMRANPDTDISRAPRRGPRIVAADKVEHVDLRTAVDKLVAKLDQDITDGKKMGTVKNLVRPSLDETIINEYLKQLRLKDNQDAPTVSEECNQASDNEQSDVRDCSKSSSIEESGKKQALDTFYLNNLLLLLKANINKKEFQRSSLSEKYPELTSKQLETAPKTKVKTYSKKTDTVEPAVPKISIWGDTPCYTENYILPPNYQSLCGCKTILQELFDSTGCNRNIRMNIEPLKFHYEKLQERCLFLFTWPLILSNIEAPVDCFKDFSARSILPRAERESNPDDLKIDLPKRKIHLIELDSLPVLSQVNAVAPVHGNAHIDNYNYKNVTELVVNEEQFKLPSYFSQREIDVDIEKEIETNMKEKKLGSGGYYYNALNRKLELNEPKKAVKRKNPGENRVRKQYKKLKPKNEADVNKIAEPLRAVQKEKLLKNKSGKILSGLSRDGDTNNKTLLLNKKIEELRLAIQAKR